MVKTGILWKAAMIVGCAGVTLAVVRTAYYYIPWGNQDTPLPAVVETLLPQAQQPGLQQPEMPRNPLLVASKQQFNQWLPAYCGADLYAPRGEIAPHRRGLCIRGIIDRVESATGRKLSPEDVMDPAVRAHWYAVMVG